MTETNPAVGYGVNRGQLVSKTPQEGDVFLGGRRAITMCTPNHDGSIHAVAMCHGFLAGQGAFEMKAESEKAQSLRRDPRVGVSVYERHYGEYRDELGLSVEAMRKKRVVVQLERVISWDHPKVRLPGGSPA